MFRLWITAALLLLVLSCAPPPDSSRVVARVGTHRITQGDVWRMMKGLERPDLSHIQLRRAAIEQLVAQELLYQEAQRRGIEVSEEEISGHLDLLRREFLIRGAFEDLRREYHLDDMSLRQQVRQELMIARLLDQEVLAKTAIDEAEMVKRPREVHQRSIYRRIYPGTSPAKRQEAWKAMGRAMAKLRLGEDFAKVAQEYSQSSLAPYGGDAGLVALDPSSKISRALFELEEGQISEILETPWGLFILKAEKIWPETMQAYGQLSPKLRRIVLQRRMQERLEEFVEELKRKAHVKMVS